MPQYTVINELTFKDITNIRITKQSYEDQKRDNSSFDAVHDTVIKVV